MTAKRKIQIIGVLSILTLFIVLIAGELFIFLFNPQELVYPTLKTKEYFFQYPPNSIINHEIGLHKRKYITNNLGHRKMKIKQGNNMILLGDSFTFGVGVNDGKEWANVLQNNTDYNIINLGMSGWGLTQQIKRFYEVGMHLKPKAIILMFCQNDVLDNVVCPVTKIKNEEFIFEDLNFKNVKLSFLNSLVIKSQLFRFFKRQAYINKKIKETKLLSKKQELLYNELLSLFVKKMKKEKINVFFISVNNFINKKETTHLSNFKEVEKNVLRLDSLNFLTYINSNELVRINDYIHSPVGHYSVEWNKAIGKGLAKIINK